MNAKVLVLIFLLGFVVEYPIYLSLIHISEPTRH